MAKVNEKLNVVGLDIGSRTAKGVLLNNGAVHTEISPTGLYMQETADDILKSLLKKTGLARSQVSFIVGTGYGRISISFEDIPSKIVTEISCHSMGAHHLNPKTRTVIDIGGQDSKAIKVNPVTGKVEDFAINDKCAAGTGKFLETAALSLDLNINEIGGVALKSEKPSQLSSQCIVFAESEIVSLKAKGEKREDIAAGIHYAVARRVGNLLSRIGVEKDVVFTGGVSRNKGVWKALEDALNVRFTKVDMDTIYAGALGAAIYARNYAQSEGKQ